MAAMAATDLSTESFNLKNEAHNDDHIDVTINSDETLSSPDKSVNSAPDSEGYHSRISDIDQTRNNNNDNDKMDSNTSMGSLTHTHRDVNDNNGSDYDSGAERNLDDEYDIKSTSPQSKASIEDSAPYNWYSTVEAKKARVENIITSMRHYPTDYSMDNPSNGSLERGRKRKQYHPQQHDTTSQHVKQHSGNVFLHAQIRDLHNKLQFIHNRMYNEDAETTDYPNRPFHGEEGARRSAMMGLMHRNSALQADNKTTNDPPPQEKLSYESYERFKLNKDSESTESAKSNFMPPRKKFKFSSEPKEFDEMCLDFKKRISQAINTVIDEFTTDFSEYQKSIKEELRKANESRMEVNQERMFDERPFHFPFYNRPDEGPASKQLDNPLRNLVDSLNRSQIHHPLASYPPFPNYYRYLPTLPTMMPPPPPPFTSPPSMPLPPEPEQTEALSLVVSTPKKKRTKVTDTRLSPRAARALLQDGMNQDHITAESRLLTSYHSMSPGISQCLPTSVAITNPSLQQSDYLRYAEDENPFNDGNSRSGKQSPLQADQGSPGASNVTSSECARLSNRKLNVFDNSIEASPFYPHLSLQYTNTLTPMHLRKAKLMFFYVRYPSSSVLKTYFPDIRFNKNNTAQLVKWFSNFREFFYIQMEKYARQSISEGIKSPGEIAVSVESEIYRVLNLHYNRNNQLDIPDKFRQVIETALREFYLAVSNGKDSEQPWKKSIYKVIQRLDDKLPDYFLSPNWMELLGEA